MVSSHRPGAARRGCSPSGIRLGLDLEAFHVRPLEAGIHSCGRGDPGRHCGVSENLMPPHGALGMLDGLWAVLAGADADGVLDADDEDLAVADFTLAGAA